MRSINRNAGFRFQTIANALLGMTLSAIPARGLDRWQPSADARLVVSWKLTNGSDYQVVEGRRFQVAVAQIKRATRDYEVPFPFTGKLVKLTVEMHPIRATLMQIIAFKWKTRD